MFEKKDVAKRISELMLSIGKEVDDSLAFVQASCSPDEYEAYKDFVSKIMTSILLDVLNPVYQRHPDIKPPGLL
ncbi:hypothetical protein [Trinickia mobilis]|uniref:hypothetical protein n=1 Tax=Trinickia mobilis TaxID=2816356 RepID=UPI001A8DDF3F|nr:hypothetical protein [Trinickia mobilis]